MSDEGESGVTIARWLGLSPGQVSRIRRYTLAGVTGARGASAVRAGTITPCQRKKIASILELAASPARRAGRRARSGVVGFVPHREVRHSKAHERLHAELEGGAGARRLECPGLPRREPRGVLFGMSTLPVTIALLFAGAAFAFFWLRQHAMLATVVALTGFNIVRARA